MRRTAGLTLIELLISASVFGLILLATTTTIAMTLRLQNLNEATSSAQGQLRRNGEVFTQELRSAVLGAISNYPYPSDNDSVSFALLDGGAGYQVLPHPSGRANRFRNATNVHIIAPVSNKRALDLVGEQVMMVNANGEAIIFGVERVRAIGTDTYQYKLVHPECGNTIDFTRNTLLFNVETLGYDFDAASGNLRVTEGTDAEASYAFGLDDVAFTYIYSLADGSTSGQAAPLTDGAGLPVRSGIISGQAATLVRVQLELATSEATTGNRQVQRTYSAHVELSSNPALFVRKVYPC